MPKASPLQGVQHGAVTFRHFRDFDMSRTYLSEFNLALGLSVKSIFWQHLVHHIVGD